MMWITNRLPHSEDLESDNGRRQAALRILDLPGRSGVDYIVKEVESLELGTFTHNRCRDDEWSLTWTRLDNPS